MIIVSSENGIAGLPAGWEVLRSGGSALDAVEAATRVVEDDPADHTVGYGGYPNLLGEVELDASIMDGTTRRAGAVGALRGFRHPITVARAVMERLPHVLLVGEGAARFARELGMVAEDLLTPEARRVWQAGLQEAGAGAQAGPALSRLAALATDPDHLAGTVNVIARDAAGRIASAVSTSGWAWKYPGRVGDSAVVGAGNYADDRWGAAACTGWGELAILAGTARSVVDALSRGAGLEEACVAALRDLAGRGVAGGQIIMRVVAIDRHETPCGVSTSPGQRYAYMADGTDEPVLVPRIHVPL